MPVSCQSFGHNIRQHVLCRAVLESDRTSFDVVAHELELHVEMFRSGMMNRIFCKCDRALIIDVNCFWCIARHSKVLEEVLEPDGFLDGLCKSRIFHFSCREHDC